MVVDDGDDLHLVGPHRSDRVDRGRFGGQQIRYCLPGHAVGDHSGRGQGGRRPPRQHRRSRACLPTPFRRPRTCTLIDRERRSTARSYLIPQGTLLIGAWGKNLIVDR